MPKVTLIGRVFPECYQIDFSHNSLDWKWLEKKITFKIDIKIVKSTLTAECQMERYKPEFFTEVYKRVSDLTRSALNLYSFASGLVFQPVFTHLIDDKGVQSQLALQDISLAELCTSISLNKDPNKIPFDKAWELLLSDNAIFQALDDLIVAISVPHQSTINCARVVEGLRHIIATPGASVSDAWTQLRSALQLDRSYLQLITDVSTAPRHGNRAFISGDTSVEITRRSWVIMDRFFEYVKRGKTQLPLADFPVLTG